MTKQVSNAVKHDNATIPGFTFLNNNIHIPWYTRNKNRPPVSERHCIHTTHRGAELVYGVQPQPMVAVHVTEPPAVDVPCPVE